MHLRVCNTRLLRISRTLTIKLESTSSTLNAKVSSLVHKMFPFEVVVLKLRVSSALLAGGKYGTNSMSPELAPLKVQTQFSLSKHLEMKELINKVFLRA
jgi:hypothetical protein